MSETIPPLVESHGKRNPLKNTASIFKSSSDVRDLERRAVNAGRLRKRSRKFNQRSSLSQERRISFPLLPIFLVGELNYINISLARFSLFAEAISPLGAQLFCPLGNPLKRTLTSPPNRWEREKTRGKELSNSIPRFDILTRGYIRCVAFFPHSLFIRQKRRRMRLYLNRRVAIPLTFARVISCGTALQPHTHISAFSTKIIKIKGWKWVGETANATQNIGEITSHRSCNTDGNAMVKYSGCTN